MSEVYWKSHKGIISVDDMDINHLRNAFKYLIKESSKLTKEYNGLVDKYNKLLKQHDTTVVELNGDASQLFNESYPEDDCFDFDKMF